MYLMVKQKKKGCNCAFVEIFFKEILFSIKLFKKFMELKCLCVY